MNSEKEKLLIETIRHNSCTLCKSENILELLRCQDHLVSGEIFPVMKCGNCGFIFINDYPAEESIGTYYKSENYISHSNTNKGLVNRLYHIARSFMLKRKYRIIRTQTGLPCGRLMDIGCGTAYFPGYNKFRDVTMILVIVQFTFPLAAVLLIQKFIDGEIKKDDLLKYGKISIFIVGGITLFFTLFPGMFYDFSSQSDTTYSNQGLQVLVDAWVADRKMLLRNDSLRSLVFILLAVSLMYVFYIKKIKTNWFIALLSILILFDMWPVAKRYLNNDDFVSKRQKMEAFQPYQVDLQIMTDEDPYFRVLDLTADPFKSSRASYFHKSIGGYHGAKMKRYQELIDYHISRNNMKVHNMLNTKYIIVPAQNSPPTAQRNPDALGNAWFVNQIRWVSNADEEIEALNDFIPGEETIIDMRFEELLGGFQAQKDSTANISLSIYKPNQLTYHCQSSLDQLVVFSDIYYDKGWNAYIDGEQSPHFRVNYVLRGMIVPSGSHQIVFKFEPSSYDNSRKIALASSLIFVLLILGMLGIEIKKAVRKKPVDI